MCASGYTDEEAATWSERGVTYRGKQAAAEIFNHGRHERKLLFAELRHCYGDVFVGGMLF